MSNYFQNWSTLNPSKIIELYKQLLKCWFNFKNSSQFIVSTKQTGKCWFTFENLFLNYRTLQKTGKCWVISWFPFLFWVIQFLLRLAQQFPPLEQPNDQVNIFISKKEKGNNCKSNQIGVLWKIMSVQFQKQNNKFLMSVFLSEWS